MNATNWEEEATESARVAALYIIELDGERAFEAGEDVESCPYADDPAKASAWKLGFKRRELEITTAALVVSLRQAVKAQAQSIENWLDVSERKEEHPNDWWLAFVDKEAASALFDTPSEVIKYSNIIRLAIALVQSDFIDVGPDGIKVDEERASFYVELRDAIEKSVNK